MRLIRRHKESVRSAVGADAAAPQLNAATKEQSLQENHLPVWRTFHHSPHR